jgi:ABC-type phosphate transport system substrate-binding protein
MTWYSEMTSRLMRLKLLIKALTLASLLWSPVVWSEDIVVVVNRENSNTVDLAYVAKIYSGALKAWPDGSPVFALDQPEDSETRVNFSAQILNRSVANMRAVWSQNIFTGKGLPPKVVSPDVEMKRLVSTNRNAIGYIRASQLDSTVKVVEK